MIVFFCQVTTHYRIDDTRWANENDSHLASRKLNDNHSQLAFSYFLARVRQCESEVLFKRVTQKRVTNCSKLVIVYFYSADLRQ